MLECTRRIQHSLTACLARGTEEVHLIKAGLWRIPVAVRCLSIFFALNFSDMLTIERRYSQEDNATSLDDEGDESVNFRSGSEEIKTKKAGQIISARVELKELINGANDPINYEERKDLLRQRRTRIHSSQFDTCHRLRFVDFYNLAFEAYLLNESPEHGLAELLAPRKPASRFNEKAEGHRDFSLLDYPFVLSLRIKRKLLEASNFDDCSNEMVRLAKVTLVNQLVADQPTDMNPLFLTIRVHRSNLLSESMEQLMAKRDELKKKLRVIFEDEVGVDMGGLTKEWFLLLTHDLFSNPESRLFRTDSTSQTAWFIIQPDRTLEQLKEIHLAGVLMGLAVYNGVNLDVHFPSVCYRKLLSPVDLPTVSQNLRHTWGRIGFCSVDLNDIKSINPVENIYYFD
ncbi:unnamed protein product [Protopolystoma xenopodis]|uniref:HECT-type E3 ubiquitin transferase n=1 Tax=Protopolystoma xenopodis TaxID=117903 RepID=A0A3S5ABG9_9PLAT|nr:unnamed protein product [Protopolystoma xenopodis]